MQLLTFQNAKMIKKGKTEELIFKELKLSLSKLRNFNKCSKLIISEIEGLLDTHRTLYLVP